jgi:hypothetical protein
MLLGRSRQSWEDNTQFHLKDVPCENVNSIKLIQNTVQ